MSKTNIGLVEYAKAMLGNPYWWGTFGQYGTKALYDQKKKQYPEAYAWEYQDWMKNKKVHDCSGLVKGYLFSATVESNPLYSQSQDLNAAGFYMSSPSHGHISDMPELPGLLVFYGSLGHVGVYIGNGEVVQCANHDVGCIKTKLADDKNWSYWGKCPFIDYVTDASAKPTNKVDELLDKIRDTLLECIELIDNM